VRGEQVFGCLLFFHNEIGQPSTLRELRACLAQATRRRLRDSGRRHSRHDLRYVARRTLAWAKMHSFHIDALGEGILGAAAAFLLVGAADFDLPDVYNRTADALGLVHERERRRMRVFPHEASEASSYNPPPPPAYVAHLGSLGAADVDGLNSLWAMFSLGILVNAMSVMRLAYIPYERINLFVLVVFKVSSPYHPSPLSPTPEPQPQP
jgi:hypothetical protein